MPYHIRKATLDDIPDLEKLLLAFMQETFQRAWGGTPQKLAQDGLGAEFQMVVAEVENHQLIAFGAWKPSYDLHHCLKGGEVIDLYVDPAYRGWGVAMKLLMTVAVQIQQQGGVYIKGQAVENPSAQRLYQRCAQCFPGADCYVSGRAFRQLTELSEQHLRDVVRNLPKPAWNYEP
ncbi:GNAT family N-acetyltransferase [Phormidium sp. FACHB-592]|uniref:GNAT family N-acetyltransferase n=1 Tax=Stenomitos frigidus AS-A4 TaxID=2933935 RepID=A0ABV0KUG3_9CYAN|nr:GNAT family N-acetyltransferase [Phormidium sp. FACHB-592]MBD2075830.1 GNAT family N-acetyltransferase [Phormidium sp. FACHB-592]